MQRTRIEWCDATINPVKGLCPMDCRDVQGCEYCYARRMYQRFKWNPEIRYDPDAFTGLPSKPARVFIGSTMELFGDWVNRGWMHMTFAKILARPQHTFLFLTKRPEALSQWIPFPENAWAGVTVTTQADILNAVNQLMDHRIAQTQFLSIEPLLHWDTSHWIHPLHMHLSKQDIDWIIIGQQTPVRKATMPKVEWIREIVQAADRAGIPVFLKDNLAPVLRGHSEFWEDIPQGDHPNYESISELRQEFPE